jgi:ABC-2 type transport system ATP-binding protein
MADITALCERVLMIHQGQLIYDGGLEGLLERFAPYREIRLRLGQPVARARLEQFGEVRAWEGLEARLLVRREDLVARMGRMLQDLPIDDLEVREPAVEEVIGQLFASPGLMREG